MVRYLRRLLCLLLLLSSGCVSPLAFTSPCPPGADPNNSSCTASGPVTSGTMVFASNFDPSNALTVTYDGQVITNLLTPPPAPNGTSTFPLPPPQYFGYATPTNTLQAAATCGFFCVYPTKTVTFTVLKLAISAASATNFPNQPVTASLSSPSQAFVVTGVGSPVTVTLQANTPYVQFLSSPEGTPQPSLTLTVSGEATFWLKAIPPILPPSIMTVSATAPGFLEGDQMCTVVP
jgi:hypothetical protein